MSQEYKNNSYEELVSLLNDKGVISQDIKHDTEFNYFLKHFNIKHGKQYVTFNAFYRLYKYWSKEPINEQEFKTLLNKLDFIKRNRVYLNINQFKITDQLLKYIQKDNKITSDKMLENHFNKFFDYYLIKPGDVLIREIDLLFLYTQWCFYTNKKPRKDQHLRNTLSINFEKRITKQGNFYLMNNNIKNIITQEKLLGELSRNEKEKKQTR